MERNRRYKIALLCVVILLRRRRRRRKLQLKSKRKGTRIWANEWLMKRNSKSQVPRGIPAASDSKTWLRMDVTMYNNLLQLVTPAIKKHDTVMREAITPNERLSATLRWLATGQTFEELKFLTTISAATLSNIVMETCAALNAALKPFIKMPTKEEEWEPIATDFENFWNFSNCIGAIAGKHVTIKKPANSGSRYCNYQKSFSVVLMAVVNAESEFLNVDVVTSGRDCDADAFAHSTLSRHYEEEMLNLPSPARLPLSDYVVPHVIVADEAFPLLENFMTPYRGDELTAERQVFNDRLSAARRPVDNAFTLLANRFRILESTINLCPDKVAVIVTTCCYLHNYLKRNGDAVYLRRPVEGEDTSTNNVFFDLQPLRSGNAPIDAKHIRDTFCSYFHTVG